ncbi:MAG: electron transport complex subunit RsxC [Kangiellaceae bacterium]|nr:electron transport complex subunit RsxC [Kangiellaceae bacterium]
MYQSKFVTLAKGKFHGGIHPQEFKSISNQRPIEKLVLSKTLRLPLKQHVGVQSIPIVTVGEGVTKGQLIAKCGKGLGANIHAPANGKINKIELMQAGHPSGLPVPAIEISVEDSANAGSFTLPKISDWRQVNLKELISQVRQAGIVGLGGATFPTEIKLKNQSIDTLIVNAMECEPYITCDDRMLQELAKEVIEGAQISAHIVGASDIIFATEDNKSAAIKALATSLEEEKDDKHTASMKIVVAPTKYPSGGEKQTIELVTGKQLPKGELPSSLGLLVQNVATLRAIYKAVTEGETLTERLITITGDAISNPGNYWLPFGTLLSDIAEHFEVDRQECKKAVLGGPMMGQSVSDFETPVSKSTNCIIFNRDKSNEKSWVIEAKQHQSCIRCSECQVVCPADLLPQQLYWFSKSEQWEGLEKQDLFDCIECGACAYVCPSEIPLVHYFRFGKSEIKKIKMAQVKSEKAKQRFDFRETRLARAKAERAEKHRKAAEARKKAASEKSADAKENKQAAINEALARVKQKKAAMSEEEAQNNDNKGEDV